MKESTYAGRFAKHDKFWTCTRTLMLQITRYHYVGSLEMGGKRLYRSVFHTMLGYGFRSTTPVTSFKGNWQEQELCFYIIISVIIIEEHGTNL